MMVKRAAGQPAARFWTARCYAGKIQLTAPNGTVYALERGRAVEAFGASLFRDTAFGKTNKGTIDAIRASEKYLVPNVSGYDVNQDCQQVDDRRWR